MFHKCLESVLKLFYICFMVDKNKHWTKSKICPVCGKTFEGTAKAQMCGSTCRGRLRRMLEVGGKPEYYVMAKSKGQKLPSLEWPKTKKPKIDFKPTTEDSFNGEKVSETLILDEVGTFGDYRQPELTKEQKLAKISELNEEIKKINAEELPPGMLPKRHTLEKAMKIDSINEQIKLYQ